MKAVVTYKGVFDMQVCVPKEFTDEEVVEFANKENPCGTERGWQIRREGSESLCGEPERMECSDNNSFCHIMLDA